jgi:hypothetical protein
MLSPPDRRQAEGFLPVIRRGAAKSSPSSPIGEAYAADLRKAAGPLREAAALTDNASLKRILPLRADAFLSNDYYARGIAWMDLDAPRRSMRMAGFKVVLCGSPGTPVGRGIACGKERGSAGGACLTVSPGRRWP